MKHPEMRGIKCKVQYLIMGVSLVVICWQLLDLRTSQGHEESDLGSLERNTLRRVVNHRSGIDFIRKKKEMIGLADDDFQKAIDYLMKEKDLFTRGYLANSLKDHAKALDGKASRDILKKSKWSAPDSDDPGYGTPFMMEGTHKIIVLLKNWAEVYPEEAIAWCRQDERLMGFEWYCMPALVVSISKSDRVSAIELSETIPYDREANYMALVTHLLLEGGNQALEFVLEHPGDPNVSRHLGLIISEMTASDPARGIEAYHQLKNDTNRKELAIVTASSLVQYDSSVAMDFSMKLDDEIRSEVLKAVGIKWAGMDPEGMSSRLADVTDPSARKILVKALAIQWPYADASKAMDWFKSISRGRGFSGKNTPIEADAEDAAVGISRSLFLVSPKLRQQWVESLEEGVLKDSVLALEHSVGPESSMGASEIGPSLPQVFLNLCN